MGLGYIPINVILPWTLEELPCVACKTEVLYLLLFRLHISYGFGSWQELDTLLIMLGRSATAFWGSLLPPPSFSPSALHLNQSFHPEEIFFDKSFLETCILQWKVLISKDLQWRKTFCQNPPDLLCSIFTPWSIISVAFNHRLLPYKTVCRVCVCPAQGHSLLFCGSGFLCGQCLVHIQALSHPNLVVVDIKGKDVFLVPLCQLEATVSASPSC